MVESFGIEPLAERDAILLSATSRPSEQILLRLHQKTFSMIEHFRSRHWNILVPTPLLCLQIPGVVATVTWAILVLAPPKLSTIYRT
jgi:hypothetical protein